MEGSQGGWSNSKDLLVTLGLGISLCMQLTIQILAVRDTLFHQFTTWSVWCIKAWPKKHAFSIYL